MEEYVGGGGGGRGGKWRKFLLFGGRGGSRTRRRPTPAAGARSSQGAPAIRRRGGLGGRRARWRRSRGPRGLDGVRALIRGLTAIVRTAPVAGMAASGLGPLAVVVPVVVSCAILIVEVVLVGNERRGIRHRGRNRIIVRGGGRDDTAALLDELLEINSRSRRRFILHHLVLVV